MAILQLIILIIVLIVCIILYLFILKPYLIYNKYAKLLPSLGYKVFIHPFRPFGSHLKQMMDYDRDTYGDVLKTIKQVYPNFDIGLCNINNQTILQIINEDLIKQMYQYQNQFYYVKADVITSSLAMLVKNGIIMKEGQQWKQRKKIISSVFTHDFLINLLPQIHKICNSRFDEMQKKYQTIKQQKVVIQVDLHLVLQQIFSQVIVRLFFGSQPSQTLDGKNICQFLSDAILGIFKEFQSPLFFLFGQNFASKDLKRKLKSFKQLAKTLVDKRLKKIQQTNSISNQPQDIIEALVKNGQLFSNNEKNKQQQNHLTNDDLIGQFCTFFVAGMDTTSNLMASLIYHLSKQSSEGFVSKLRQQIKSFTQQKKDEFFNYKELKKMVYTQNIVKQGLRVFSPVSGIFFRKTIKDHYLGSIYIPKGMTIVPRNRSNFFKQQNFKDCYKFNPDRWLQINHQLNPFSFIPFSAGARTCIGNSLSIMQSKIVLVQFLKRYKKFKLQKQNYKMVYVFFYAPQKQKIFIEK